MADEKSAKAAVRMPSGLSPDTRPTIDAVDPRPLAIDPQSPALGRAVPVPQLPHDRPTQRERGRGYRDEKRLGPDGRTTVTVRREVVQLECPKHEGRPYRYDAFEDAPGCPFCATGKP